MVSRYPTRGGSPMPAPDGSRPARPVQAFLCGPSGVSPLLLTSSGGNSRETVRGRFCGLHSVTLQVARVTIIRSWHEDHHDHQSIHTPGSACLCCAAPCRLWAEKAVGFNATASFIFRQRAIFPRSADCKAKQQAIFPCSADCKAGQRAIFPSSADGKAGQRAVSPRSADGKAGQQAISPRSADCNARQQTVFPCSADCKAGQQTVFPRSADGKAGQQAIFPCSADGKAGQQAVFPRSADCKAGLRTPFENSASQSRPKPGPTLERATGVFSRGITGSGDITRCPATTPAGRRIPEKGRSADQPVQRVDIR